MSRSRNPFVRLYRGETTFDVIGRRWVGFGISLVVISAGVLALGVRGLELGIDFRGGVAWEVPGEGVDADGARAVLAEAGIADANAKIQTLQGAQTPSLRVQVGDQPDDVRVAVREALAARAGVDVQEVSVSAVSSSWGRSVTDKAIRALLVFFVLVSIYMAWRLEWKMAVTALVTMVHDVVLSVGVYAIFGFEVTPATVVAFLTILGYSLYDTVVVFDRVKENAQRFATSRQSFANVANVSTNEVLARSLNTTLSSALPVAALLGVGSWIMGAASLSEFAVALLVGMVAGTYSSIFVAVPVLEILKRGEPHYRGLEDRIATGDAMAALMLGGGDRTDSAASVATQITHAPRPRKKKRRPRS
jgi:preprotein translocase subunit SecF